MQSTLKTQLLELDLLCNLKLITFIDNNILNITSAAYSAAAKMQITQFHELIKRVLHLLCDNSEHSERV